MRRFLAATTLALAVTACQDATRPELRPPGMTVTPDTVRIQRGTSAGLIATVVEPDGTVRSSPDVEWRSADPAIAEVAVDGTVTGVREGGTTITARAGDLSATANVQVHLTGRYRVVSADGKALPAEIGPIECGIEGDHTATYVLDSGLMTFQVDYYSAREMAHYECSNGAHGTAEGLVFGSYALSGPSIQFFDNDGAEVRALTQGRIRGDSIVVQWTVRGGPEPPAEPFVVDAVLKRRSP